MRWPRHPPTSPCSFSLGARERERVDIHTHTTIFSLMPLLVLVTPANRDTTSDVFLRDSHQWAVIREITPLDFAPGVRELLGVRCILQQTDDDTLTIKQKKQAEKLTLATTPQEYIEQRARGAYIASICRPEAAFDLSTAAQSSKSPNREDTAKMNKRIKWQMENRDRGLHYIPIDIATAKLYVFVDGSFANNKDLSSQIGFVIMLSNEVITNPAPSFNILLAESLHRWRTADQSPTAPTPQHQDQRHNSRTRDVIP